MAKTKFYAVRIGRKPGVYKSWAECKTQVDGYPGAVFKSFPSKEFAEEFVSAEQKSTDNDHESTDTKNQTVVKPPDGPYAFVDGSFNSDTNVYGFGGFLVNGAHKYALTGSGNDPEMASMRNVSGEILGAIAAVQKAEELGLKTLTILYDYQGIESWVNWDKPGGWKNTNKTGTRAYRDFMTSRDRTVKISFCKVAGHTGVEGNEIADAMARNAVGAHMTKKHKELLEKGMN